MAFTGNSFVFDGISSEQYGLILCDFATAKQEAGKINDGLSIQESRTTRRFTPLHYGIINNSPKTFPLVFVVSDSSHKLDRYDVASIAGWLTGHADYKELIIVQPDMQRIYYKCIITNLEQIEVGMRIIGFTATVVCDSPYAYFSLPDTQIEYNQTHSVLYRNFSNVNEYYYPVIEITCEDTDFEFINTTNQTTFSLTGLPTGAKTIKIDALNQVMTSSDGANLYEHWNVGTTKVFPRFTRGDNWLSITATGAGTIKISNVFPWNVGN